MFGNEIQEFPLRHEGDEFAVRRRTKKLLDQNQLNLDWHFAD
jgi:hypothetical protein